MIPFGRTMCVCVCVCVCSRSRSQGGAGGFEVELYAVRSEAINNPANTAMSNEDTLIRKCVLLFVTDSITGSVADSTTGSVTDSTTCSVADSITGSFAFSLRSTYKYSKPDIILDNSALFVTIA